MARFQDSLNKWRCSLWLGGIPGPLESEGLWGALHKNEEIIISLLVGGGYHQIMAILG